MGSDFQIPSREAGSGKLICYRALKLISIEIRARSAHTVAASADGKAKTVLQVAATAALLVAAAWPAFSLTGAANALLVAATALTLLSGVRLVLRAKQTTADAA